MQRKFVFILCIHLLLNAIELRALPAPKELKVCYKKLKKESKALHQYLRVQQKNIHKIELRTKQYSGYRYINASILISKINNSKRNPLTQRKEKVKKDSVFYAKQVEFLRKDIADCRYQITNNENQLKQQLKACYKNSDLKTGLNAKMAIGGIRNDKRLYYLRKVIERKQAALFKEFNMDLIASRIKQAKIENLLISKNLLQNPGSSIPSQYQLKQHTQAQLPQQIPGVSDQQKQDIDNKLQRAKNEWSSIKDSIDKIEINIDSIHFKPNPYRLLPLNERFLKRFDWQSHQAVSIYPSIIDFSIGIGYKFHPKFIPSFDMVLKTGLGSDINHIAISQQGFGLRTGGNFKLLKNAMLFFTYEQSWYKNSYNDNKSNYQPRPGLVIGVGIQSKIKMQLGYDFLKKKYPETGNPWVIRFGI